MDCIFCEIINKNIESNIIYENENIIAFLDAFPEKNHQGHTLVVPKKHQCLMYEKKFNFDYMDEIIKVSNILKKGLQFDGLKIINNNEGIAGQEIQHVHVHLIPYYQEKCEFKSTDFEKIKYLILQ